MDGRSCFRQRLGGEIIYPCYSLGQGREIEGDGESDDEEYAGGGRDNHRKDVYGYLWVVEGVGYCLPEREYGP